MPGKRLSMNKIREILRLRLNLGFGVRKVGKICNVSHSTVLDYERRIKKAGLSWDAIKDMNEPELLNILSSEQLNCKKNRPMPDFQYLFSEMKKKNVTLTLPCMSIKRNTLMVTNLPNFAITTIKRRKNLIFL